MKYTIAVVHGDGIGPEVCAAAVAVLQAGDAIAENMAEYMGKARGWR